MPVFKKSRFYEGLIPEQFSFITGINETVEEKTLIKPHTRYIMASTDYADGVSFRKLGLSTDGFGFGRLPYDATAFANGYGRGMGIFQLYGGSTYFSTYFATPFPTSAPYPNNTVNELDQWNFTGAKSLLSTLDGPSFNPVGTQLPCHVFANFMDILTDDQYLNGIWNINGTVTTTGLIQQGNAPVLSVSENGSYAYYSQFGTNGTGNSQFMKPIGVAVDTAGNIYVVDQQNQNVQKFNSSGVFISVLITGLNSPTGLTIDSVGNIYVLDTGFGVGHVYKYNSSGVFQSQFSGSPNLIYPAGISTNGLNFFVTDKLSKNVQIFNTSGVYQSSFNNSGNLSIPVSIFADSVGDVFVSDEGDNFVKVFNTSGVYESQFGGPGSGNGLFRSIGAVALDSIGNAYVTDEILNNVQIFNTSGVYQSQFGGPGSGNGLLNTPNGIAIDSSNNIFIVDAGNSRIQEFTIQSVLSGDYAYCYTFVDINGNESQPSPLGNINGLSSKAVTITINPGSNVNQAVWSIIRIYRTVTSANPIGASQNPTFYYVPGLDIVVTGASSYTTTDSIPDSVISTPGNSYTLSGFGISPNADYENGALQALPVGSVPKFLNTWNGQLCGANWIVNNVRYPIRVYWSASNDNSGLSAGNNTNWNSLNYIDVGTVDDGNIIGLWPGLQGRLYVFKEYATYVIEPTGQTSGIVYGAVSISSEYGLYHHSIAEIGGAVIGRTKDNVMIFNGSSYKPAGNAPYIRKTVNRCIVPEADSGVYDTNKQRYYLAVCDTSLTGSFQTEIKYGTGPIEATTVINCYRNTVLAFDIPTSSFEIHHNEPVQVFGKLKDNGGRERIFALGMSSDIFILFEGNFFGANFSFIGSIPTGDMTAKNIQGPIVITSNLGNTLMAGAFLAIPFFINSDGTVQFLDYLTVTSGSATSSGEATLWSVNNLLPLGNTDIQMMVMIANVIEYVAQGNVEYVIDGSDYVVDGSDYVVDERTGAITLTNNIYQDDNMQGYGIFDISSGEFYSGSGFETNGNNQSLIPINSEDSVLMDSGDQIIIVPLREFENIQNNGIPVQVFLTPPMGSRLNDTARKAFELFRMQIKGNGTLNIYGFKDGNETYKLGPYFCTPDETHSCVINSNPTTITNYGGSIPTPNSYQQMISLQNQVGYYQRIMIWMPRSSGWFEIQDFTSYYRLQEELASL